MKKKRLSPAKAKTMLKDNQANGRPLSSKQKGLFGAIAGGAKQNTRKRGGIAGAYESATKGLQAFGANIGKNIAQGQKDFKAGKLGNYGAINPFKAKRKLQRGMAGYKK